MIKIFEQFNRYKDIKKWLDEMGIDDYTINNDFTVDVKGLVDLSNLDITEIPIQFGKVTGSFHCTHTKLTSLKGCPDIVGGGFYSSNTDITSLEYGPSEVGSDYWCYKCNLTTLKFVPKKVGGAFIFNGNFHLPKELNENFNESFTNAMIDNQEEYGIWNSDGSFNKDRWEIFLSDYNSGVLT